MDWTPLPVSFFERDVCTVARDLIGCVLRRSGPSGVSGRIIETEAYRHDDPASHSFNGRTDRNEAMFGPAGRAYVYLIYGVHTCFNVVCGTTGIADAVLIRAVEPISGLESMWQNRYGSLPRHTPEHQSPLEDYLSQVSVRAARPETGPFRIDRSIRNLTAGPGRLTAAFGIHREAVDGTSLQTGPFRVGPGMAEPANVCATRRIGLSRATELPWRFVEAGNPFISRSVGRLVTGPVLSQEDR